MQRLFWFGCIGMVIVAGVIYLAANSTPKTGARTLGQVQPASTSAPGRSLSELATFGSSSCTQDQHGEPCSPLLAMPPQIIDVCQPVTQWSINIQRENELIPASAEEPLVVVEEAEAIAAPVSEETEETAQPAGYPEYYPPVYENEPEELTMPKIDDAGNAVQEEAGQGFWLSFFGDILAPAQEEEYPGDDGDDQPMDEVQEEPACQEDPHRHEHYPVCPYTGRSYCPTVPASTKPMHEEPCEPCPKNQADPESPAQPGVDTMEFRPSDAKEGEFESKPM